MTPAAAPSRRRTRRLSTSVLWTTLAVFVVVAAPSLWLAHRSFERVHREDALSRLSREHAELAEALDDRLEAAEASATRVAKLLDRDLSQLRLDGGEGPDQLFNELLEARDDGTWRNARWARAPGDGRTLRTSPPLDSWSCAGRIVHGGWRVQG